MSQLQEEKTQLQEELVVLRERLALHDSDQHTTATQLQNQVPGEAGTAEASVEGVGGRRSSAQTGTLREGRGQELEDLGLIRLPPAPPARQLVLQQVRDPGVQQEVQGCFRPQAVQVQATFPGVRGWQPKWPELTVAGHPRSPAGNRAWFFVNGGGWREGVSALGRARSVPWLLVGRPGGPRLTTALFFTLFFSLSMWAPLLGP